MKNKIINFLLKIRLRSSKKLAILVFVGAGVTALFLFTKGNPQKFNQPAVLSNHPETQLAREDVLRLLIWEGHAPKEHIEKFEKHIETKYGRKVKLDIKYASGTDAFYNAIRSKEIDLVMMTHHYYKDERFKYIKNKLLLPLNLENIPNYKYVIPALQKAKQLHSNGNVYASPVSQGPYGLAYNTALLKEEPKSWNILWDPRFKGKYVIGANEYTYNANITALALGYARENIGNYNALNNKEFKDKLRQLAVNAHSFWIGVDKPDDLSGMPLATSWGDALGQLRERGEPWAMAEPDEGMSCWFESYAITWALANKPFLKKVAEEYINGVISTNYQVNHITRYMSLTPVITNIGELLTVEEKVRLHVGIPNFFTKNRILQRTYSKRDRNGLKVLWEEAMKGVVVTTGGNK